MIHGDNVLYLSDHIDLLHNQFRDIRFSDSTMSLAPPFTKESAHAKVKKAQDLWNGQCVVS